MLKRVAPSCEEPQCIGIHEGHCCLCKTCSEIPRNQVFHEKCPNNLKEHYKKQKLLMGPAVQ